MGRSCGNDENDMKKCQRKQMPRKCRRKRGEKDRIRRKHVERVGEDWRESKKHKEMEIADRVMTESSRTQTEKWKRKSWSTHP